jgi:hypothetical protein
VFHPVLTLLAVKAKAVGLVAGTALATSAVVGGGAMVVTSVSEETPITQEVVENVDSESADAANPVAEGDETDTELAEELDAEPVTELEEGLDTEEPDVAGEDVTATAEGEFVCDDSKNHGQNVSAYARSLPKGPGRGEKVSAAAQSDCGKQAGDSADAEDSTDTENAETEDSTGDSTEGDGAEATTDGTTTGEEQADTTEQGAPMTSQSSQKSSKKSTATSTKKDGKTSTTKSGTKSGTSTKQGGGAQGKGGKR